VSVAAASFAEGDRLSSGLDAALPELVEVVAGVVAGGPMVLVNAGLVALLQARDRSDAWSSPRPRGAVVGLGQTSMTAPTALADMHSADRILPEFQHTSAELLAGHARSSWAFILQPVDPNSTRLLVRCRGSSLMARLQAPVQFVMQRKMMLGIKQRAEASVFAPETSVSS
jgi:hypothetical protein